MASTVIQTPHVALTQYRSKLQQAANELEATMREVAQIAGKLNEGGLVGRTGTAMSAALTEKLNPAINALYTKTMEEDRDIAMAIQQRNIEVERENVSKMGK
ncbi:MAG: hypothetical protein KDJ52_10320 [Anaerolineae bacterium]|nr:hypothetical protein [Anaerolineae bacterium]